MSENKIKIPLNKDKWLNTITILMFVVGLLCVGYVLISNYLNKQSVAASGNLNCVKDSVIVATNDEYMSGVIEKGEKIKILTNFYNCNDVRRGDIAWYQFSNQIEPVARTVWGLPGDNYSLTEDSSKKGYWRISINGQEVTTNSEPYYIYSNSVPPLKTYELSRGGVLLADEYILLSNRSPGLSDSSNLGLIHKKELIGKVAINK